MSWASRLLLPRRDDGLAAAATVISGQSGPPPSPSLMPTPSAWQEETWSFFDRLGMFRNAVSWRSDMLSRVRLRAGRKIPGADEPEILDDGPAAEIISELSVDTQSQVLSGLSTYISVPGEGFVVGEEIDGVNQWMARSVDEVRYRATAASRTGDESPYEVIAEDQPGASNHWRRLAPNSMVARVWRPHPRRYNVADSNSRAALPTMRELELVNRAIAAGYMSRLAMAGLLIFPSEIEFPVRKEFVGLPDGLIREFIERASEAIRQPGTAASCIPLPIQVSETYVDKIKHLDFTSKADLQLIAKRDSAIKQLAIDLDTPPEALTGLSDANHWSAWQIEESGFKVYLAPDVELICAALTKGYLRPRLAAAEQDPRGLVVWYDASEITQRPDKSANTLQAFDRGEANGAALRREIGLNESDKPTADELAAMILWQLASNPQTAASALRDLTGHVLGEAGTAPTPGNGRPPAAPPVPSDPGRHIGPPAGPNGNAAVRRP
jgi:hypothetical protein